MKLRLNTKRSFLGRDKCQITSQTLPCVGGEVVVVAVGSWNIFLFLFVHLMKTGIFFLFNLNGKIIYRIYKYQITFEALPGAG